MPKILISWLTITPSVSRSRYRAARCSNMYLHSKGGPGSINTWTPSSRKAHPGAVPTGLSNTTHPTGSSACCTLFSGISRPNLFRNHVLISSRISSWSSSSLPKVLQMVCLVRSSYVGPSPPVVMMMSARPRAVSSAWASRWGLSPTTV